MTDETDIVCMNCLEPVNINEILEHETNHMLDIGRELSETRDSTTFH